jgi:hypothetical protein
MVRIAISQAAFDPICATLPLGDTGYENATNDKGERLIWLPHEALAKLNHARGQDESYSDVILLIAAEGDEMSEERILLKFVVGQRVVKQGGDSRFEGEVVACFVKRNHKTMRCVVENDDGVLHVAGEAQLRLAMPKRSEG